MKFLCVDCDEAMSLSGTTAHQEIGSLSVTFACPKCGRKTAMLTNPVETQLVSSLGVTIGPKSGASDISPERAKAAAAGADMSKCPFAAMVSKMEGATGQNPDVAVAEQASPAQTVLWSESAAERLNRIPEFIRKMARTGIENFARERGYNKIDERVLDEAKVAIGL